MSNIITYDILIFTFVSLCMDNFLSQLVCLLITILPAAFYIHCLPFECTYHALTICQMSFDIWEVRIMSLCGDCPPLTASFPAHWVFFFFFWILILLLARFQSATGCCLKIPLLPDISTSQDSHLIKTCP